jgi:hypothetical protein
MRQAPTILTTKLFWNAANGVPHLEGEAIARDFSLVARVLVA